MRFSACVIIMTLAVCINPVQTLTAEELGTSPPIETLARSYFSTAETIYDNEISALQNFETIISGKSSPVILGGLRIFGSKFLEIEANKVSDWIGKLLPHGDVAVAASKAIWNIDNEKEEVAVSNNIIDYIVTVRTHVNDARSELKQKREKDVLSITKEYSRLATKDAKSIYYKSMERKLSELEHIYRVDYNEVAILNRILNAWINGNNTAAIQAGSGYHDNAYHKLSFLLDENWEIISAEFLGTKSDQLTARYSALTSGKITLSRLRIPIGITWFPRGLKSGQVIGAIFDENGQLKYLQYTWSGRWYLHEFANRIGTLGIKNDMQTLFKKNLPFNLSVAWGMLRGTFMSSNVYEMKGDLSECCTWDHVRCDADKKCPVHLQLPY